MRVTSASRIAVNLAIILLVFTGSELSLGQIPLSGNLSGTLEDTVYSVIDDVYISSADTLFILPGAELRFSADVLFTIDGRLVAEGVEGDSVFFIPDVEGENWGGLDFTDDSHYNSHIYYCHIEGSNSSGIFIDDRSSVHLRHSLIVNNSNEGSYLGGGIYWVSIWTNHTLEYCTISSNENNGLYISGQANVIPRNCVISGNSGTGLIVHAYFQELYDLVIEDNSGSDYGGGLFVGGGATRIEDCVIRNNTCSHWGGGVRNEGSVIMERCVISGNTAVDGIGGMGGEGEGADTIRYNLFEGNEAPFAGALTLDTDSVLDHCTIVNNTSSNTQAGGMGGVVVASIAGIVSNSVFYNNYGLSTIYSDYNIELYLTYNDFNDNEISEIWISHNVPVDFGELTNTNSNGDPCDPFQNIIMDPLFTDASNHDYSLLDDSPCINAGDPDYPLDANQSFTDLGAFPFDVLNSFENPTWPTQPSNGILAYPNPFNSSITIVPRTSTMKMKTIVVYNVLGKRVSNVPVAKHQTAVSFAPKGLAAGVYFIETTTDNGDIYRNNIIYQK
ncbi:right-handed parallel beta-helix repeat-containing protein [bacterium]|nr:right-handed parallel beta-helix repeat-containing protein [bacterium]